MMASLNKIVVDLIALNGGSIVGKTRLQKTVYLLEQCGVRAGMDFDYHYYGPYSQEVTQAARWTELEGALSEQEYVTSSGDPYSVFTTRNKAGAYVGELSADQAAEDLNILKSYNSAELELAATIITYIIMATLTRPSKRHVRENRVKLALIESNVPASF